MTDVAKLDDLIARLEKATGPDVELDHAIGMLVGVGGDYTRSIDAALTLVPDGWFVASLGQWRSGAAKRTWAVTLKLDPYCDEERHTSNKPTPAIALCIAALYARRAIAKEEQA